MTTLEKIRAEIDSLTYYWCEVNPRSVIDDVLQIIDKYAEQEPCENCDYSEIMDWEQDAKTGKAKPLYWCERHKEPCDDVVSRQAVINLIRGCNSALEEPRIFDCHNAGVKFAQYVTELPSVRPQEPKTGHWIPVSERLPDKYGNYLVTKKRIRSYGFEDIVEIGQYTIGCQWNRCDSRVTAWMPLLKPYEPQESEESE